MTFQTLAIVLVAGVCGPLLASGERAMMPVIVGELAAGALLGSAGFKVLDPTQPTFVFLASAGFLMLMFASGMHVPVRSLASSAGAGAKATLLCTALALLAGVLTHTLLGGPALVFALLTANSSAAVILPLVQECSLDQKKLAATLAQVTIADVLTIITLPLVLAPAQVVRSALGALAVLVSLTLLGVIAHVLRGRHWVATLRARSRQRGWALELRIALIGLFALAAVAEKSGISLLIAGFSGGLLLSWLGGPKRLDKQVAAVAQGFFVPIFFVSLGTKLNVGQVFTRPSLLALALALMLSAAVVHVLTGAALRHGRTAGLLACAQLGLPAAAADLGLRAHAIDGGQAAAIVLGGLGTIALSVFAAASLRAAERTALAASPAITEAERREAEMLRIRWQKKPEPHDFETAEEYLSLVLAEEHVLEAMRQLRDARHPRKYTAKEIFNAAELTPLTAADTGVAKKLARLAKGKRLPPIMIVHRDGAPLILAAGYHRACTGYVLGKQTPVAAYEAHI
jgi:Kef-type K+ transport system membrane component KefB